MQELRPEEMYGIAKKFNNEMQAIPLHQHSAVVELIRVGMQVRQLGEQRAAHELDMEQRAKALRQQEQSLQLEKTLQRQAERALEEHLTGKGGGPQRVRDRVEDKSPQVDSGPVALKQADGCGEPAVEEPLLPEPATA